MMATETDEFLADVLEGRVDDRPIEEDRA